jgi:hypothetical protein
LHSPDLTAQRASELISRAPEFNRYARLVDVESITRQAHSLAYCCYDGVLTFRYLDAPASSPSIKAYAAIGYWDDTWHLTEFDYGCDRSGLTGKFVLSDCRHVDCYNPAPKSSGL